MSRARSSGHAKIKTHVRFGEFPMKAFIVDRYKSKLRVGEMPDPELRDNDVLVQIHAAGRKPSGFQNQRRRVQAHLALSLAAHFGQ